MSTIISPRTARPAMPLIAVAAVLIILSLTLSSAAAYSVSPTASASFANAGAGPTALLKAPVSLSANPKSVTIAPGGTANYVITAHNKGTKTFTVKGCILTVNGAKVSCILKNSNTIGAGKTVKISFSVTTTTAVPPGTYNLKLHLTGTYGTTSAKSGAASFVLIVS